VIKKIVLASTLGLLFFLTSFRVSQAALITIDKNGQVILKVLSSEDQLALSIPERKEIEVSKVATEPALDNSSIALSKEDGKVYLKVGDKQLDVTDWNEDLVEIEERVDSNRIEIAVKDGEFVIMQDGLSAKTSFPINVEPVENKLSVETASGETYLTVFPIEAAESALRSKYVTRLPDKEIGMSEKETGILTYAVDGEREIEMLKFMDYAVPVTVYVSASTGEIVSVDQPTWLRVFGFLLI
jgi:hypothetical protein